MKPRQMMILGGIGGVVMFLPFMLADVNNPVIFFALGALFGKGYGVSEERSREQGRSA